MVWLEKTLKSLQKAKNAVGTQKKLELLTGVSQSRIAELLNGRRSIGKTTYVNVLKLFPEIDITFFKHERPSPEALRLAKGFDGLAPKEQRELLALYNKLLKK